MTKPTAVLLLLGAISSLLLAPRCTPQIPLPPPQEDRVTQAAADAGAAALTAGDVDAALPDDAMADGAPAADAGAPAVGSGAGPAADPLRAPRLR